MQVILLRDVRGCGHAHEVKTVADGFATNFLFPRKLATPATEEKIQELEAQAAARAAERRKESAELDHKIQALHGKEIIIEARATEKGGLFKAIHAGDIVKAIRMQQSLEIPQDAIQTEPIKTLGGHTVELAGPTHKATLTLTVRAGV